MSGFGCNSGNTRICNCEPAIVGLYYAANDDGYPAAVTIRLSFEGGLHREADFRIEDLDARHIAKAVPEFFADSPKRVNRLIHDLVSRAMRDTSGKVERGLLVETNGLHRSADGHVFFVIGQTVIGDVGRPYMIDKSVQSIRTDIVPSSDALLRLVELLAVAPPAYVLALVFLMVIFLRSTALACGLTLQAVGYIIGQYGRGKSYLAKLLTGWIISAQSGRQGLIVEAISSQAGTRDEMARYRDLPLVSDDVCRSESPRVEAKRIELISNFIRQAANESRIIKKAPGGQTVELNCQSGAFVTSEIPLENPSDVTRCLWIPLDKQANTPPELDSMLVGAAIAYCIEWVCGHYARVCEMLRSLPTNRWETISTTRAQNNFRLVDGVFQILLTILRELDCPLKTREHLQQQFNKAVKASIKAQETALARFHKPPIIDILREAVDRDMFDMAKKPEKLWKHESIIWHGDLCIRKDPLERFIRAQLGYEGYTLKRILQDLKDAGVLVIQEEGTYQVHITHDAPRTYRIRLK